MGSKSSKKKKKGKKKAAPAKALQPISESKAPTAEKVDSKPEKKISPTKQSPSVSESEPIQEVKNEVVDDMIADINKVRGLNHLYCRHVPLTDSESSSC